MIDNEKWFEKYRTLAYISYVASMIKIILRNLYNFTIANDSRAYDSIFANRKISIIRGETIEKLFSCHCITRYTSPISKLINVKFRIDILNQLYAKILHSLNILG